MLEYLDPVLLDRIQFAFTIAFHIWCMALTLSGFIAVISGWLVTEIGRKPYIVYCVMRTSEAVSPVV